ncbi:metallophosphoesterase [Sporosarcina thermotolerans]|uniref:Metallophosphoesterase n=1 Tax=Sporosarcina thermotolerans TaxID=633404 RepID=A0AAW9ABL3_9BACL|nr:metallophosphoesterase [Sporosarcina thermotolerans]MDW0118439.1 metallophosphoesterase [Sporosarcina thermotolerans]WHT49963.1 metallophosphoesterase [Sporosarcina thermotolerans]
MRGKLKAILIIFILTLLVGLYLYKENSSIGVTFLEIESLRIPTSFDNYRIVQLSDIHDSEFGEDNSKLVNKVKQLSPNAIFITGDFIDGNRYDLEQSLKIIRQLQAVAPFFYVTGNHEISTNDVEFIKGKLDELGVHVLTNESIIIGDEVKIAIGGIDDPLSSSLAEEQYVEEALEKAFEDVPEDMFKMLLSHRPYELDSYVTKRIDLVFSGHAHGGQIRIPGIGALIAPGQGWFPEYTSGIHEKSGTHLVISRGLGNSIIPIRVFNQPEIVVVTLKSLSTE